MKIAVTANLFVNYPDARRVSEGDSESTILFVLESLRNLGFTARFFEGDLELVTKLREYSPSLVFNMCEGYIGAGRELLVPAVLEAMEIKQTGSNSIVTASTMDKYMAKVLAGIKTPVAVKITSESELDSTQYNFPLLVKPLWEGSSIGIDSRSCVSNLSELRSVVSRSISEYNQPALVEEYISGPDITVGILWGHALPVCFVRSSENIFSSELKAESDFGVYEKAPADISERVYDMGRQVYERLGLRGFVRVDFKLREDTGEIFFLEVNAFPQISPDRSYFAWAYDQLGLDYSEFISDVISPVLGAAA